MTRVGRADARLVNESAFVGFVAVLTTDASDPLDEAHDLAGIYLTEDLDHLLSVTGLRHFNKDDA